LTENKNTINILYWIAMAGMLFWFVYSKGYIFANFESIEAKHAIALIEKDDNISLLDVRTIEEYKEGHVRDATLIPLHALSENLGMLKADKNKRILVYCQSGNRSIAASRILEKQGFTAINIKGGILKLQNMGMEVVK
jgi:rhodanese-related sulfurtransferase